MKLHLDALALAGALSLLGISPAATAQVSVNINVPGLVITAPPAPRYEAPPAPRGGFVWVPGRWAWNGHDYVWRPGRWAKARAGYDYAPGRWIEDREAGAGPKGIGDGVKAGARVMSIVRGTSVVAIRTLIATMNTGRTTARRDKPRRAVAEQGLWAHAGNMPADAESSTASRRRQTVENANPWQPSQGLPARCLGRRFDIRPASRIAPTSKSAGWPQRCSRRGNSPRVPGASLRLCVGPGHSSDHMGAIEPRACYSSTKSNCLCHSSGPF